MTVRTPRDSAEIVSPASARDIARGRVLLLAVAIGTTLAPLNSTMIAVSLPDIQHSFGVSVTATSWLVTLYLVAMAVGQPIGGRLGDLYGRRTVYLIGLIWFALASIGCVLSGNLWILILFRTQQALAGAMSFPNGVAMVRESIPAERRGSAFGVIGMATGMAAAAGPAVGGVLVHTFGWSAIFWANVPVVGIAALLGWWSLPKRTDSPRIQSRFDVPGSALFATTLGAFITIPSLLKIHQPSLAIAAAVIAVACGGLFLRQELRANSPVVDVRLFQRRSFAAACASVGLSNLVMYTTLLALPLYLERVRGHSVQMAGFMLAAMSAFSALWGPLGGRWSDRTGRRTPAIVGAGLLLMGTIFLAAAVHGTGLPMVAGALAGMGLGLGIMGAPVQSAAVEAVPRERTGSAAGIFSTSRYIGSVIGSTALTMLFTRRLDAGDSGRFVALFAVLALVGMTGVLTNLFIDDRPLMVAEPPPAVAH